MLEACADAERLYVPLHDVARGVSLCYFHDQAGCPCTIGFTDLGRMAELLGPDQISSWPTVRALREPARSAGVTNLIVDPAGIGRPGWIG